MQATEAGVCVCLCVCLPKTQQKSKPGEKKKKKILKRHRKSSGNPPLKTPTKAGAGTDQRMQHYLTREGSHCLLLKLLIGDRSQLVQVLPPVSQVSLMRAREGKEGRKEQKKGTGCTGTPAPWQRLFSPPLQFWTYFINWMIVCCCCLCVNV